jgi:ribose 5-phosphate isomerase B
MRIAIGSDHAGFTTKEFIKEQITRLGHSCDDLGTNNQDSVDYPDFARAVACAVAKGQCERGILICGTGLGMCITANKIPGIRAVTCHNEFTAEMSRRHNDANILCLGARVLTPAQMEPIIKIWLATPFEAGRHARRLDKITESEKHPFCNHVSGDLPKRQGED